MNIFIIGGSQVGKSTISKKIKKYIPTFTLIEMGSYFKDTPKNRTSELTKRSLNLLRDNHKTFYEYYEKNKSVSNIIVGVRNPLDFALMFNPNTDIVIITEERSAIETEFEKTGIKAISEVLLFSEGTFNSKIFKTDKFENFDFKKQCEGIYKKIHINKKHIR